MLKLRQLTDDSGHGSGAGPDQDVSPLDTAPFGLHPGQEGRQRSPLMAVCGIDSLMQGDISHSDVLPDAAALVKQLMPAFADVREAFVRSEAALGALLEHLQQNVSQLPAASGAVEAMSIRSQECHRDANQKI